MSLSKTANASALPNTPSRSERAWTKGNGPSVAYHEMGHQHVIRHDEIELLNIQLGQLEDLISRISFMSRELRQSLKVK